MKFTPRQYQIEGKEFLQARRFALLGDAPGVGKTGQAIIAMEPSWKVLVVCPASVKNQWQQAFLDWRNLPASILNPDFSRLISGREKILIVNYDLMIRDKYMYFLTKMQYDLIIYDEAHKLKSMTAKRTKVALSQKFLRPRAQRIWFLTGTPIKNRPIDLYPILRSCAPEVLGPYQSYLKFAYRYCGAYQGQFGLNTMGASNIDELRTRLKTFMLRREKRDVLDELPPRVVIKQDLECTSSVKKLIREEEMQTLESAGEDDPSLFKLGEIARIRQVLAKYKVPLCVDYVKELLEEEEKIVVFYHHKEVLRELRRAFEKIPHVFIDGTVPPGKRGGVVETFRTDKTIRLFFGQMQACGEGIDGLQSVCSTCVFIEPSWSHTDIEQCVGRLERSGQRSDINVHILVIKDTIESRMMDVVKEKLRVDNQLYKPEEKKKEKTMAPVQIVTPVERIANALELIAEVLRSEIQKGTLDVNPETETSRPTTTTKKTSKPVEVKPEPETDVTEDAIRARASDICALSADGKAKAEVIAEVKKICGGKIVDLKTPKQRVQAMAAMDKLYDKYAQDDTPENDDV